MSALRHDPVAAAAADDVPQAARERPQLGRDRRRDALARVVAARVAPAPVGGPREPADARVLARAAVVDARGGDVADAPAGGVQAALPVLLVAVEVEPGVEAADALERAAAQRQVRAPHELGVAVVGPEVERRDGRRLAPAGVQVGALELRLDRPAERLVLGVLGGGGDQRAEPARPRLGVVVEEAQEVRLRGRDRGVAGRVEPARLAVRDVARAVLGGERLGLGVGRVVLDHDQLGAVLGRLGRRRGERDGQVVAALARRDQDRGGRGHRAELRLALRAERLAHGEEARGAGEEQQQRERQVESAGVFFGTTTTVAGSRLAFALALAAGRFGPVTAAASAAEATELSARRRSASAPATSRPASA